MVDGLSMSKGKVVVGDTVFSSYRSACRASGIKFTVFEGRFYGMKWSLEESLGIVERKKVVRRLKDPIEFRGDMYYSYAELCRVHGVGDVYHELVYVRYKRYGWSLEEALGIVARGG